MSQRRSPSAANVQYEFSQSIFELPEKQFIPKINQVSKQLTANRKGPVHSRLYQLGVTVKRPSSGRTSVLSQPISEERYSVQTPSTLRQEGESRLKVEDQIVYDGIARRSRLDKKRKEQQAKRKAECNFKPEINYLSEVLAGQRPQVKPRHELLYDEARIREEKRQTKDLQAAPQKYLDPDAEIQLVTRLMNSHKKTENMLKLARSSRHLQDAQTGVNLYSPDIRRSQSSYFKLSEQGSYYSPSEPILLPVKESQRPQEQLSNDSIYAEFKAKQIQLLFELMDQDHDDFVTEEDFTQLDTSLQRILRPVAKNCSKSRLAREEFVWHVQMLCSTLCIADRGTLLKRRNCTSFEPCLTSVPFTQPVLSPRSQLLAAKSRANLPTNIYERQALQSKVSSTQRSEESMYALQSAKARAELSSCTFSPSLQRSKR
jgi:hypothetical protein